ncbi:FliH/SctL family protein [Pelagibacterium halotolerans]|uniref:FlbE protein n=1 Tax=Pelagibacterium halotolerans (strain DSM 22347 / JCM 15775 / CGMCC 1.7692 / B2) TaxID=1082931 RepID=G4R932_PELHB|nr:FliH/SctL family protein [Pelagibacterium halotolerans]AEQ52412.1 FlbE protein [Pelagibacterium halotolerans B2]QJR17857.1 flagellar assembly protein FliH [Pelagibacterium halotolerans]SEA35643.1 flagellar assembly protein FliH [Pelagibacterium halotolerans]
MSVAHKFTFDLDLAHKPPANKVLPEAEFDRIVAAARQEGYNRGLAEGQSGAQAQSAATLAKSAEKLASQVAGMVQTIQDYEKRHLAQSVGLAATVGRKLAAHLIAREPQAELAALLHECVASLEAAPHLVIRCHPDLCDAIKAIAEERMKVSGLSGRLIVLGDPEIRMGDGRVEWADGGLVRDINAISNEINTRVSAYLAARGAEQGD